MSEKTPNLIHFGLNNWCVEFFAALFQAFAQPVENDLPYFCQFKNIFKFYIFIKTNNMQIIQQQTLPVLHNSELSIFFIKTIHNNIHTT